MIMMIMMMRLSQQTKTEVSGPNRLRWTNDNSLNVTGILKASLDQQIQGTSANEIKTGGSHCRLPPRQVETYTSGVRMVPLGNFWTYMSNLLPLLVIFEMYKPSVCIFPFSIFPTYTSSVFIVPLGNFQTCMPSVCTVPCGIFSNKHIQRLSRPTGKFSKRKYGPLSLRIIRSSTTEIDTEPHNP